MKITLVGAAGGEVTGSAYLVRTKKANVLIDCGQFQGGPKTVAKNRVPVSVVIAKLDGVLLTHAHLDHTGRLPLLFKRGYRGKVFATPATIDLAELILADSARIQAAEADREHRRKQADTPPAEPLYGPDDLAPFRSSVHPVAFQEPVPIADGLSARWIEAGHMLGSASIELTAVEEGRKKTVVFSGDLGPTSMPVLREFQTLEHADAVFLESTYGDRCHRPYEQTVAQFERIVEEAVAASGKILVPTFAIGRSQQMLYHLVVMFLRKQIPPCPVFLDSPMAVEASKVYVRYPDLFDNELLAWKERGLLPLDKTIFQPSVTADESRRINETVGATVVLAGSGMCNAGRILHHLRANLADPSTHVLIVGYQGAGSVGRRLVERQPTVRIFGKPIQVRAQVHTLNGFSGHADQGDLLKWYSHLAPRKPLTVLTHGEDRCRQSLAAIIRDRHGVAPLLPKQGDVVEI